MRRARVPATYSKLACVCNHIPRGTFNAALVPRPSVYPGVLYDPTNDLICPISNNFNICGKIISYRMKIPEVL